jgi:signal transduction histidine kinase
VALLSQSVRRAVAPKSPAAQELEQISRTSQEMTRAMEEIVWAVDPAHDSLDGIANYLGRFAQDFLSAAGLQCRLDMPTQLPSQPISADIRHNLFLAFKEALNNVVRHAAAREVNIELTVGPDGFVLSIKDDGRGFDSGSGSGTGRPHGSSGGRGTPNLLQRMAQLGGTAEIDSQPGQGTRVRLRVPWAPGRVVKTNEVSPDHKPLHSS